MQLSAIRTRARKLADEVIQTNAVTNSDIDGFINARNNMVYSKIIEKHESFFAATISDIAFVANQDTYALTDLDSNNQTRIEHIKHVKIAYSGTNYIRARPIPYTNIPDTNLASITYTQNDPRYLILGDSIQVFPTPTANNSSAIKLWYLRRPVELSNDTDVPAYSPLYHHILAYGAAADILRTDVEVDIGRIQNLEDMFLGSRDGYNGLRQLLQSIEPRDTSYPTTVTYLDSNYEIPQELYVPPSSLTL